jgi:hypothetical protein
MAIRGASSFESSFAADSPAPVQCMEFNKSKITMMAPKTIIQLEI